jgi:hypothetical protein
MTRMIALVWLAGCASTTFAFSPTVTVVSPKAESCTVDVMTSPPTRTYQEVGTLDFYNGPVPKTLDAFKQAVTKQVCSAGGDAVIAISDDKGQFTKGTVIAYMGPDAPVRAGQTPTQQNDNELPK